MKEPLRITLNVLATYGRSLYGLALGLLCVRWALMALGVDDYGIYGLVGGLTLFISFLNTVLAGALARFYAIAIGAKDREGCMGWFNTALLVNTAIPLGLIAIGYPLGVLMIKMVLTIPPDRLEAAVLVFRLACLTCFVNMVSVPFTALYTAKQNIAELTLASFFSPTLNTIVLWYMVNHDGVWLTTYAAWMAVGLILPQLVICALAFRLFPECRIRRAEICNWSRVGRLAGFSGYQLLGMLSGLLKTQGLMWVINCRFGPRMNAAQSLGNTVQAHCNTLGQALHGAFVPVITQACGARDYAKMNAYVHRTCQFGVFSSLFFMIPLAPELPEVMRLWLGNPPEYVIGLCLAAMIMSLVSASTAGHVVAVNAVGKIGLFHLVVCGINLHALPAAYLVGRLTNNVFMIVAVIIVFEAINSLGRILFARKLAGVSIREWMRRVAIPIIPVIVLSSAAGAIPRMLMESSITRIVLTALASEMVFLPLLWFFVFDAEMREFVKRKLKR